jgi:hypothetical protein
MCVCMLSQHFQPLQIDLGYLYNEIIETTLLRKGILNNETQIENKHIQTLRFNSNYKRSGRQKLFEAKYIESYASDYTAHSYLYELLLEISSFLRPNILNLICEIIKVIFN